MTLSLHTPGPWTVEHDTEGFYIRMEALGDVDKYLAVYASTDPVRREADALLIAAAPDLLAACEEEARNCFNCKGIGNIVALYEPTVQRPCLSCAAVRTAISKAKGEA